MNSAGRKKAKMKIAVRLNERWYSFRTIAEIDGLREGFKIKQKKRLDSSNAHLTPSSQAERWIKKIQKLHNFFMYLLSL